MLIECMCHCYDVCPWDRCWRSTNWPQLPAVHISREVCTYDIYVHTLFLLIRQLNRIQAHVHTQCHTLRIYKHRYILAHVHTCKSTNAHVDTYTCMLTNLQSSIHTTTHINVWMLWTCSLRLFYCIDYSTCIHLTTWTQCTSGMYTH